MSVLSQKEAVYNAIMTVFNNNNISFNNANQSAMSLMTSYLRNEVNNILVQGLSDGSISFGKTGLSSSKIRAYASGLQSNWLRKDSRLNGGSSASSASSANSSPSVRVSKASKVVDSDTQIKALRSLLKIKTDPNEIAEIEGFINKRVSEITSVSARN
jgi:hypothetical protein